MKRQKQQVLSRFFAPKPKTNPSSSSPSQLPDLLPHQNPLTPPPKIQATVTFSPSKKRLPSSQLTPSKSSKKPKLSVPPLPNPTLHQKFLQKLLEPSENVDSLHQPSRAIISNQTKYTPLEQQVVELKHKYPDVLLMIEVGYKYRFFGEDAEIAARVLGIYAHVSHNYLTASIPTFRLNVHVRRLVSAGYKVGVVKQTETAAIKAHGANRLGPFCRGLSALYTKATLEATEDVGGGEEGCGNCNNYLLCVVERGIVIENLDCGLESGFDVRIGIVAIEISTGDVVHGEFNDGFMRSGLEAVLLSISPVELLLGDPLSKQTEKLLLDYAGPASNVSVERVPQNCFKDGGALAEVMSLYENTCEEKLFDHCEQNIESSEKENNCSPMEGIMSMPELAIRALALMILHLKQFGFERILCQRASLRSLSTNTEITLSANTLQQLEVLKNNFDGSESGSLFQSMNHTLTIFGSRLMRHWVSHPLCDRNMISARLDAVSEIVESMGPSVAANFFEGNKDTCEAALMQSELHYLLSSVLTTLGRSVDIQRGITRIFHRTATASEFIAVIQAILLAAQQLQQLPIEKNDTNESGQAKPVRTALLRKLILIASSSTVIGKAAKLLSSLNKEAADRKDLLNLFIISGGQFPEVAKARTKVQSEAEQLDMLITSYRKQLRMHNLEFTSISGTTHLIELPLDVRVPSNWVKVNSTKKMIRYHTPEVVNAIDKLSLANEELTIVCRAAWDGFLKEFATSYTEFQCTVQALAALDCLLSLAIHSRNKNYVRPVLVEDSEPVQIHICSGRHPVLDVTLQDNFVPNDTRLNAEGEYCQIVTGPNMGGKSCYIRQVALISIMAQVGSFVPASSAQLHVLDGIYTRMGASDSIQRGRSTFLEELSEASYILKNCTSHSLVIIDELGRGTSTHDGVAIAFSTLHHLLKQKCMVLFVTHYPKIVDILKHFPGSVGPYHVLYMTSYRAKNQIIDLETDTEMRTLRNEDVTYLYKLVSGVSERSFGFKVAQLAQLPSSLIHRAIFMATKLEAVVGSRVKNRLEKNLSLEAPLIGDEQVAEENAFKSHFDSITREMKNVEELTKAYKKFFLSLKSALEEVHLVNGFELLIHAKSLANELIIRPVSKNDSIDLPTVLR